MASSTEVIALKNYLKAFKGHVRRQLNNVEELLDSYRAADSLPHECIEELNSAKKKLQPQHDRFEENFITASELLGEDELKQLQIDFDGVTTTVKKLCRDVGQVNISLHRSAAPPERGQPAQRQVASA